MADSELEKLYEEASKCDFVRFTYADINGIARGRSFPASQLKSCLEDGIDLYAGVIAVGPRTEISFFKRVVEERNCNSTYRPQPGTFHEVPWSCEGKDIKVGEVFCEPFWHDGTPQGACGRYQARKQLDRLQQLGYEVMSSVEAEFYVMDAKTLKPLFETADYALNLYFVEQEPFLYEMCQLLAKVGVDVESCLDELGPGQIELPLVPKKGIEGADQIFGLKQFVKEICAVRGLMATFMSKPFLDQAGSGFHYNHSVWTTQGKNAFYDPSKSDSLSDVAQHWIAGILKHSRALCALACPTVNCYRRMHKAWAPDRANWGIKDRETLFRVKNSKPEKVYMEYRLPSSAVNPYLMIAGTLAAGIDGIQNKLQPPPPSAESGERLPDTLDEALKAFEEDKYLCEAFGEEFVEWFLQVKREGEMKKFKDWCPVKLDEMLQKEREEYMKFI